mmetsp:Transcript_10746/g.25503  ORF Transcript_10746/g.25503 Transcript_10746/m.25503 type:complete len:556 (+) Transcript_10746:100-1767(+)
MALVFRRALQVRAGSRRPTSLLHLRFKGGCPQLGVRSSALVSSTHLTAQRSSLLLGARATTNSVQGSLSSSESQEAERPPVHRGGCESGDEYLSKDHIMSTFRWPAALGGEEVSVIGSFTDWEHQTPLGRSSETGDFVRTMALPPGTYEYKYLVDGVWRNSPCEANTKTDKGTFNNHRLISPSHTFVWNKSWGGSEVFLTGDFAGWAELIPMLPDHETGDFSVTMSLPPGMYSVQFLVDGQWMLSPHDQIVADDNGHQCNKVVVKQPKAFHILYATGWDQAVMVYRVVDPNAKSGASWQEVPMRSTPSRSSPAGGKWMSATVPAPGPGHLEFWVLAGSDSSAASFSTQDEIDRPLGGEFYVCPGPGGYKLANGRLRPFKRATEPPVMLVSDLDGTMVGDTPEFDSATDAFRHYWENNSALANSVLVYNTGRSVGQFVSLLAEKEGRLAVPDVLITAVGTKVWLLEGNREHSTGSVWREDEMWAKRLDEGWDLEKVRVVGRSAVASFGDQIHWLDDGSEHPHRVAFSVDNSILGEVIAKLKQGFSSSGVKVMPWFP